MHTHSSPVYKRLYKGEPIGLNGCLMLKMFLCGVQVMATAGKYNLFNMMGAEPEAKLKNILAKMDIDYQQHFPPGFNVETKEAALSNILNSIKTSRKLILFRSLIESNFATDQTVIKEQNIEKNIEQIRVVSLITKKILNTLLEEAINQYLTEEQMKAIRIIMAELRRKYTSEKDERLRDIYDSEIQKILTDESFQRNLQRINQDYLDRIQEHDIKIDNINNQIGTIKENKSFTVNEATARVSDELANHTALNSDIAVYRDVIPTENRDQFMKDFLKEYYRSEKSELKKYIALDKYDQAKVEVQLPSLINYQLARNNNKSIKELAKREPDFEKIFIDMAKKNGANLSLLTSEQIKAEAKLLADKFKPTVLKMINGKKEKITLREECVQIEAQKQKEKVQLQTLYSKLDLPTSSKVTKTPAALEFDDFLSTVEITPKAQKATNK